MILGGAALPSAAIRGGVFFTGLSRLQENLLDRPRALKRLLILEFLTQRWEALLHPKPDLLRSLFRQIKGKVKGDGQECPSHTASGSLENGFGWGAYGFKPATDVHLGVGFATEMAGGGAIGGGQVPLDNGELLISALDHKPMDRVLADDPANLALEFFQTGHAFLFSPRSDG
jgi:hypothetical protein